MSDGILPLRQGRRFDPGTAFRDRPSGPAMEPKMWFSIVVNILFGSHYIVLKTVLRR